jgi:AraC family transcriptional regulator
MQSIDIESFARSDQHEMRVDTVPTLDAGQYAGDIAMHADVGGLLVSMTRYARDLPVPGIHSHVNAHISLFLAGRFIVSRENEVSACRHGDVTLFRSGQPHMTFPDSADACAINVEIAPAFMRRHDLTENVLEAALREAPGANLVFFRAYECMQGGEPLSSLSFETALLRLLLLPGRGPGRGIPDWARRAREHLDAHWVDAPSLDELARSADCHPITIAKHFHRYFSCTPGEYLRRIRTQKAVERIRSGKASLSEIAFECGFSDQSHLGRTVRRYAGLAPGEIRRL